MCTGFMIGSRAFAKSRHTDLPHPPICNPVPACVCLMLSRTICVWYSCAVFMCACVCVCVCVCVCAGHDRWLHFPWLGCVDQHGRLLHLRQRRQRVLRTGLCAYTHTYIPTHVHTYVHSYVHTHMHNVHGYIRYGACRSTRACPPPSPTPSAGTPDRSVCTHTHVHTYVKRNVHTYIHNHVHTCIRGYRHTAGMLCPHPFPPSFSTNTPPFHRLTHAHWSTNNPLVRRSTTTQQGTHACRSTTAPQTPRRACSPTTAPATRRGWAARPPCSPRPCPSPAWASCGPSQVCVCVCVCACVRVCECTWVGCPTSMFASTMSFTGLGFMLSQPGVCVCPCVCVCVCVCVC
jgi:hypothetical protein